MNSACVDAVLIISAVFVANKKPTINASFENIVKFSVNNINSIKIVFKQLEEINNKKEMILIIFLIFSSKSSKINLFNSVIDSSEVFIIIIIFFNSFLSSFKLKNLSLLNIIFFFSYTSLRYKN